MTQVIIDDVIPRTQLVATAGQTVFNTNWTADAASDVLVYARADGVSPDDITQLVSSSDYTVTFIGGSETVRVTFLVGRSLDDVITIVRDTPADRMNLYINTNFTPSMLNEDFGILTLVDQQAQMYDQVVNPGYNVSATIDQPVDTVLPILAANQIWAMNEDRTSIIAYDVPAGGGIAPSDATYLIRTANADLDNAQVMAFLASGLVVNTTLTGIQLTRILTGVTKETLITNGSGISGNPTVGLALNAVFPGTEGVGLPEGTTAERPGVPVGTNLRFNADLIILEYWDGSNWVQLSENDGVVTLEGTENQVLVNGTFGTPLDGVLTLTLPQDIDETSSPTFTGLTVDSITFNGATSGAIDLIAPAVAGANNIAFPAASGTLALTSDLPTPSALSKTDDTNVTLTLGGSPLVALLAPTSLTLGWTGQLSLARGGTNASLTASNGGIVYSTATTFAVLAGVASAGRILRSGLSTAPTWSTTTYPATNAINTIMYASAANVLGSIAAANSSVLLTGGTGVPVMSGAMTNGQLIIGNTGNTPTVATLTAGPGITITNTAGAITISGGGGGYSWTEVTGTSQAMAVNNGYIANNAALVTFTLPATAAIGDTQIVQGKGAGLWRIAQNASQVINFGDTATTTGVGGSLTATNRYDSIELICITANTTWAVLTAPQGVLTVV